MHCKFTYFCDMNKGKLQNDIFTEVAENIVIYKIKTSWLQIAKCYDFMAATHDATLSMAFVLLAINEEEGTPVTKIAPRIGMEPNSLSRVLKTLIEKKYVTRSIDKLDKRKVIISITATGKEKRRVALKAVFNLEQLITKDITALELASFFKVANTIPTAIEKFKEDFF